MAQTIVADHAGSHAGVPEIAVFARIHDVGASQRTTRDRKTHES
ncbi:hypothetical protein [Xanthomonas nasturtii]|nr:hypothetical protein [Xanthomonas nasturtii]WVL57916.1 hypothetical protein M3O54_006555 [Xanthomonas nasturtii]